MASGSKQRQRGLGQFAAHQRGRAVGQCLLQPVEGFRLAPGHFRDDLAGGQQVARLPTGQLGPQIGHPTWSGPARSGPAAGPSTGW